MRNGCRGGRKQDPGPWDPYPSRKPTTYLVDPRFQCVLRLAAERSGMTVADLLELAIMWVTYEILELRSEEIFGHKVTYRDPPSPDVE